MKNSEKEQLIWYACYGSNMDLQRFLIYIQGGNLIVNGQTKIYRQCEDDLEVPRNSESYIIHHRLYFAKESGTWNQHGVGFISTKKDMRSLTYARLYLISRKQFKHLFISENGRRTTNIDYKIIDSNKFQDFDYNFYSRIIQLEDNYKGYPVMTFTNKEILPINNPMDEYLQLISNGLSTVHQLNNGEIAQYFKKNNVALRKATILKIVTTRHKTTSMILDKKQRRLTEFCAEGNLHNYSNILEQIFNEIELTGCRISARYDTEASNHNYETDGCRIQISLKKRYNNPLEVIWTILHEFGHHHSGKAKTSRLSRDQKLIRENEAWQIAQGIANKYPELLIRIDDFVRFKNECLQTYIDNY